MPVSEKIRVCLGVVQKAPGFRAKVSGWGMLQQLDTRGFASQHNYPHLAHLAPEVLLKGAVTKVTTQAHLTGNT